MSCGATKMAPCTVRAVRVGVLGFVEGTEAVRIHLLVADALDVADEGDAAVGGALEALGRHAERRLG